MASVTHYDVGDIAELTVTFKVDNANTDPTTVTAKTRDPDGTVASYLYGTAPEVTQDAVGSYRLTIPITKAGRWYYRWEGTGIAAGSEEGFFQVDVSQFDAVSELAGYALTTLDQVEVFLDRVGGQRSEDDYQTDSVFLIGLINGYSLAAQNYINRRLRPLETAAAKRFRYDGGGYLNLAPYEARTVTSVVMHTQLAAGHHETVATGDYELGPSQPNPETGGYLSLAMPQFDVRYLPVGNLAESLNLDSTSTQVTVTGNWGATTVPEDAKIAVHAAIAQAYRRQEETAPRVLGDIQFAEAPSEQPFNLPSASRALLAPYMRARPQLMTFTLR